MNAVPGPAPGAPVPAAAAAPLVEDETTAQIVARVHAAFGERSDAALVERIAHAVAAVLAEPEGGDD